MNAAHYPLIADFKKRGVAILCDDYDATGRSVMVAACQNINESLLNEALTLSRGLPWVAVSPSRAEAFLLTRMYRPSPQVDSLYRSEMTTNLYVSVDAREGISTGISIHDRVRTLNVLGEVIPNPRKLIRPGHIFPVETCAGGILVRHALPEGALDIVRICGYTDAAFFIDMLDHNGAFLAPADRNELARTQRIPCTNLSELTAYRLQSENLVMRMAEANLPIAATGPIRSYIYRSKLHGGEHLALVKGDISPDQPVLTRVQMEFTAADVFGGSSPPSRQQIQASLRQIGGAAQGVFLYLRRSTKGCLKDQIMSVAKPESPRPTLKLREYGIGAQILYDLGVRRIKLLTNTGADMAGLKAFGLEIVGQYPLNLTEEQHHG